MKKVKILVAAGMMERKFFSKLEPVIRSEYVESIYLSRKDPFSADKVTCYSPRGIWASHQVFAELYRVFSIIRIILKHKPDVLIGIGMVPHGLFVSILGILFRKKVIISLMGKNDLFLTYQNRRLRRKLLIQLVLRSAFIGTRGTRSKKWLVSKGYPEENIFIPQNIFDFNDFHLLELKKEYDMVYVGLLNYYKRVDILIDAVHLLVHKYRMENIKLAIIGKGKLKDRMAEYAKKKNVKNNVYFLATGDKKYLNEMLNKSKIFVMTSQGEGLPMVVVEAMSCGLPAVIFDDADIGDVAQHDKNSLLCPLHDVECFAKNVHTLLTDKELYQKLSKGALQIKEEKREEYSLEHVTNVWDEVFKKLNNRI